MLRFEKDFNGFQTVGTAFDFVNLCCKACGVEMALYYDAWENDNDTEPVLSLIYEITKQLSVDFSLSDRSIVKTAGAIVEAISGHNVNGIKEALTSDDPFTKFKEQKDLNVKINDFFSGLLAERGNRLVVFIDELDRCKPTFAVHLLEQIKHYIFDDRITFVFSVNLEQLQHTIKHYYGLDFDSCRYLDRFFDLRIAIPPANMDKFYSEIGLGSSYWVDTTCRRIIKMMNFELREIGTFTVSKDGVLSWAENTDVDDVNTVIAGLKMMGFTAKEEKKATKKVAEVEPTKQPDVTKQPQEQADDESDNKLIVEIPRRLMDDKALANLDRIIEGKGRLIRKAIGADCLEYEVAKDRVRFPWFALTEDAEEAKAYTTFISKLAEQAQTAKRVTLKDKPVENEKYAFRCFLLRLGFIGDEYKEARKVLLKNLTGNGAWKDGGDR
jgi:hypothetical protein